MYFATSTTIYIVKNFLIDKYERVITISEFQCEEKLSGKVNLCYYVPNFVLHKTVFPHFLNNLW